MRDLLLYGPALVAWVAVLAWPVARREHRVDPARRALWVTLLCLALALSLRLPLVYAAVDQAAHLPNLARLLTNGLILVAGWSVQVFFIQLNYPGPAARPHVRRAAWLLLGALTLLTGLFLATRLDEATLDFTTQYADQAPVVAYRVVYLTYLGLALVTVVRLAWRYAGLCRQPALHLGLWTVVIGGIVGLAYVMHWLLYLLARFLGVGGVLTSAETIADLLAALAITLMIVGATLPAWGRRAGVPTLYRWLGHYHACRRLYPLWRDLCRAFPGLALEPPPSMIVDALTVRGLGFRLARRVVEIRDGQLALRPFVDSAVAELARARCQAAGLADAATGAVVEASCLAAALRAHMTGQRPERSGPFPPAAGGRDLASEAQHLGRVAACYRQSPIVRALLEAQSLDAARDRTQPAPPVRL